MKNEIELSESKSALSASKRALLQERLQGRLIPRRLGPSTMPKRPQGPSPLSFSQQQLFFLDQLESDSAAYNLSIAVRLRTIQYWAYRWLVVAREHEDSVYRYIRNMTDGIKELKLNQPRRRAFLSDCVEASIINCRRNRLSAMLWYAVAINWGNGLFYAVIGTILFILPKWQEIPSEIARGYCLIILYMAMPLQLLLEVIPILSKARVSAGKIRALEKGLSGKNQDYGLLPRRDPETRTPILELSKVQHCYRGEDGRVEFVLGPIDLTLYPGEIVFIIGGKGSGKSTLAFLLVGLYRPESGEIQLDGEPINDGNLEYYRQHFSAIFSTFFCSKTYWASTIWNPTAKYGNT